MIGRHAYMQSGTLYSQGYGFYALLMAAMRKADSDNVTRLRGAYPEVWDELTRRYNAPGGCITEPEREALLAEINAERVAAQGGDGA